ncbi:MAG: hypothetical protein OXE99_06725 [Cellvibrionales bacterium]|nr:hypothetical protein [Cellvibrionales bacterium]
MNNKILWIIPLVFSSLISHANECVSLIQNAMYDYYVDTQNHGNQNTFKNKVCTKYNEIKKRELETGADVNVFEVVKVDNAEFNAKDFKEISKSMCEGSYSHQDARQSRDTYKKFVNPRALSSFDTCVKRLSSKDGLVAETVYDSQFSVSVEYRSTGSDSKGIDIQDISISNLTNCKGELKTLVKKKRKLKPNHRASLSCTREEKDESFTYQGTSLYAKSASITISTSAGDVFRKLPMKVSGPSESEEILSKIEEIRIGNVPRGTVIPWLPNDDDWIFDPHTNTWKLSLPVGYKYLAETHRWESSETPYFLQGIVLNDLNSISNSDKELIGKLGGKISHRHTGTTGAGGSGTRRDRGKDDPHLSRDHHTHSFKTSKTEHIPPYVGVVFIQKSI